MEALLNYMYMGEVNCHVNKIPELLKAAEVLQIIGLIIPDENINAQNLERRKSKMDKESVLVDEVKIYKNQVYNNQK